MYSILIVEDEPNLAEGLKFNLDMEGYRSDILSTAEEAQKVYSDFDLVVLDIMLPGMSGIELLKKIRAANFRQPVLILSAKSEEEDLVAGLSAGADDYVTKPFSLAELLLRIKRILERQSWESNTNLQTGSFSFGSYWINFETLEAKTTHGVQALTQYECHLMKYLIGNSSRAVTREELLQNIWGYTKIPQTRTVDIFIARMRKLFEIDTRNPKHIKSVRSVGYRFFK